MAQLTQPAALRGGIEEKKMKRSTYLLVPKWHRAHPVGSRKNWERWERSLPDKRRARRLIKRLFE